MSLRDQTLIREQAAEVEFWKARALQLSEAVTELSERLAAAQANAPAPADPAAGSVEGDHEAAGDE